MPPIAAVREGATLPKGRFAATGRHRRRSSLIALALALLGYGLFVDGLGDRQPRLLSMAVGVLGLFIGVAMVASRLARPLASVLGRPFARTGGAPARWPARTRCGTRPGRRRPPPR